MATKRVTGHIHIYTGSVSERNPFGTLTLSGTKFTDDEHWIHVTAFELDVEISLTPEDIVQRRVTGLRSSREGIVARFTKELAEVDEQIKNLTAIENSNA